jgi:hypothetical protein
MDWKSAALGFAIGASLTTAAFIAWPRQPAPQYIDFESKFFSGPPDVPTPPNYAVPPTGFVTFGGTLAGEGVPFKNNSITGRCSQDRHLCTVAEMDQPIVGSTSLPNIDISDYDITKWTSVLVAATLEEPCDTVTLNIMRNTQEVEFVTVPTDQEKPNCKDASSTIKKWTLEPPLWERKIGIR